MTQLVALSKVQTTVQNQVAAPILSLIALIQISLNKNSLLIQVSRQLTQLLIKVSLLTSKVKISLQLLRNLAFRLESSLKMLPEAQASYRCNLKESSL